MASIWVRASVCALFAALALTGCGDDSGEGGTSGMGGLGGSGGGIAGMAGMMPSGGGGGMTGGAGGMTGGVGGGGMTGGVGGMTGGVGGDGGTSGMGTGGMMGGGNVRPGCEIAETGTPADLHAAAQMALKMSCGASGSCHSADEGNPRAMLAFAADSNLNMLLVDKPACQAPTLMIVKSGGGQAALDGSYLWQKLTGPVNASMEITPKAEWGMPVLTCDQTSGFGMRMPPVGIDLSDTRLAPIRNWICAGAAGP